MVSSGTTALHRFIQRIPSVDEISFWLALNAAVMLYIGISELILGYGPGTAFSAGGVVVGLFYGWFLARRRRASSSGDLEVVLAVATLVVLGDVIVTGILTPASAFLDFTNIMLGFTTYRELRPATTGQSR